MTNKGTGATKQRHIPSTLPRKERRRGLLYGSSIGTLQCVWCCCWHSVRKLHVQCPPPPPLSFSLGPRVMLLAQGRQGT